MMALRTPQRLNVRSFISFQRIGADYVNQSWTAGAPRDIIIQGAGLILHIRDRVRTDRHRLGSVLQTGKIQYYSTASAAKDKKRAFDRVSPLA